MSLKKQLVFTENGEQHYCSINVGNYLSEPMVMAIEIVDIFKGNEFRYEATCNLGNDIGNDSFMQRGTSFLDVNNYPFIEDIFINANLGEPYTRFGSPVKMQSTMPPYCEYPLFQFNMNELRLYDPEGVDAYTKTYNLELPKEQERRNQELWSSLYGDVLTFVAGENGHCWKSIPAVDVDLETLQNAVGGNIETVPYFPDLSDKGIVCFCNEDGKLSRLPIATLCFNTDEGDNVWLPQDFLCGNLVFVSLVDDEWYGLDSDEVQMVKDSLSKHLDLSYELTNAKRFITEIEIPDEPVNEQYADGDEL